MEKLKMDLQLFASTPSKNSPIHTSSIDETRKDLDVSKDIARLMPDETPFAVILMRAKKRTTGTQKFYWTESELGGWWAQTTAEVTAEGTEISVTDASLFRARDIIKVPATDEVLFVVASDEEANKLTVKRGHGTTGSAVIPAQAWLMRMGNAMEQFSRSPESKITQPKTVQNITQIFRRPFDQSMTSSSEDLRTNETERVRLRKDQAIEHRLDIERALLFGEYYEDIPNARSTTKGLYSFTKGRMVDAENKLNEKVFEDFCEELFEFGSGKKLFICSPRTGRIINDFARDKLKTISGETTYGLRLQEYQSFHGLLYLVPSKTLEKDYRGLAFGVDMDNIEYRPLKGRDTKLRANIQENDADGWKDEYLTEAGFQLKLPKTHAVLTNCDVADAE